MGYIRRQAIIVTTYTQDYAEKAIEKFNEIAQEHSEHIDEIIHPSEIFVSLVNGYRTFLIPPDGSKLNWEESDYGEKVRALFIVWMREQMFDDDSGPYAWVYVQYGDDMKQTKIIDHSDAQIEN